MQHDLLDVVIVIIIDEEKYLLDHIKYEIHSFFLLLSLFFDFALSLDAFDPSLSLVLLLYDQYRQV